MEITPTVKNDININLTRQNKKINNIKDDRVITILSNNKASFVYKTSI